MICFNCKKEIQEKEIAIEKLFSFGFGKIGFFIICKNCQEKLNEKEIKQLEEDYQGES